MNKIVQILLLASVLSLVSSRQWFHDVKATSLTDQSFGGVVGKDHNVVIEFFTPWCVYCQQMSGEWNRLYSFYEEEQSTRKDIKICKINCEEFQSFCQSQHVHSFPAIKLYVAGQSESIHVFQGMRRFEDFKHWIEHHVGTERKIQANIQNNTPTQEQNNDEDPKLQEERRREQEIVEAEIRYQERVRQEQIRQQEIQRQQAEMRLQEEQIRQRNEQIERVRNEELLRIQREEQQLIEQQSQIQQNNQNQQQVNTNQGEQQQHQQNTNESNNDQLLIQITLQQQTVDIQNIRQQTSTLVDKVATLNVNTLKTDRVLSNLDFVINKQNVQETELNLLKNQLKDVQVLIIQLGAKVEQILTEVHSNNSTNNKPQVLHQVPIGTHQSTDTAESKGNLIILPLVFLSLGVAIGYLLSLFKSKKNKNVTPLLQQVVHEDNKQN